MPKYLIRIIALLLICCLVVDPVAASACASPLVRRYAPPAGVFLQEALSSRSGWIGSIESRGISSKIKNIVGHYVLRGQAPQLADGPAAAIPIVVQWIQDLNQKHPWMTQIIAWTLWLDT